MPSTHGANLNSMAETEIPNRNPRRSTARRYFVLVDLLAPALAAGLAALYFGGVAAGLSAALAVFAVMAVLLARNRRRLISAARAVENWIVSLDTAPPPSDPTRAKVPAIDELKKDGLAPLTRALSRLRVAWVSQISARESYYKDVIDTAPLALVIIDAARIITTANQAARSLFHSDVEGRNLIEVMRAPEIPAALAQVFAAGAPAHTEFIVPGTVSREIAADIAPLGTDGAHTVLALTDLTEIRRTKQLRTDFVANASHEIRSPLAAIIGILETLRGPAREDAQARDKFLGVMAGEANRMARLVDDLLSLSKIEMRAHATPDEAVDIFGIAQEVAADMTSRASEKNMTIDIHGRSLSVVGDRDELGLMLRNLLSNSISYGHPGTTVQVRVRPLTDGESRRLGWPERGGAVSIVDESDGIPAEHIPRLTERFYRVDKSRSRKMGGTGLGLAIVKHVINRHGGDLTIKSEVGRGSEFTAYLRGS